MSAYNKVQAGELPTRRDGTDGTVIYEGFITPGADTDEPLWAIRKNTLTGTEWVTTWAGGDKVKNKVWDDRATDLGYVEIVEIEK